MKEQQGSALENQHQHDSKRANESHLQHNQPQDLHRAGQLWENPSQVPQTTGLPISENNPTGSESDRSHNQESESQYLKLQKMSSQQARGVEPSVNSMNRNPKQVPFAALLPTLMAQLDKDRALQLRTLYARLKVCVSVKSLDILFQSNCFPSDTFFFFFCRKMKSPKRDSHDI